MLRYLPNFLTLGNLFCGCCAIVYHAYWQPETALWFTIGSFVLDYLDGMAARAIGVQGDLGKQLDSLADLVSFGVVPAFILYNLIAAVQCWAGGPTPVESGSLVCPQALPAFLLPLFAAYRLAKFNLDTRQTRYFLGLSTPACTLFVVGLALGAMNNRLGVQPWIMDARVLYGLILLLSWLMVCEIPMFGLKINVKNSRENLPALVLVLVAVAFYFVGAELALPAAVFCYVLGSLIFKKSILQTS